MDASSEGKSQAKAAEAEELELLLKKGAYYAIKDRDDSKQFCDEDILSILTTRTRNVSGGTSGEAIPYSVCVCVCANDVLVRVQRAPISPQACPL